MNLFCIDISNLVCIVKKIIFFIWFIYFLCPYYEWFIIHTKDNDSGKTVRLDCKSFYKGNNCSVVCIFVMYLDSRCNNGYPILKYCTEMCTCELIVFFECTVHDILYWVTQVYKKTDASQKKEPNWRA